MPTTYMQLFRYSLVGIGSNACLYLFYILVTSYGIGPYSAAAVSYFFGAAAAFLANRQWTFACGGHIGYTLLRYALSHLLGYGLNLLIIYIFFEQFGYAHQLAQAAAIMVVAGFLFVAFKYFVFTHKELTKR